MLCRLFLFLLGLLHLHLCDSWLGLVQAQQTFFPAAVPLAVRTPTFNCWLQTGNGSNPMTSWPTFWNNQHILGWAGYIKVDGQPWHWLGAPIPGNASTWLSTQITPTRTIITVQAGPMQLNVTFLSPVEPSDWSKQSFPFSYVYIDGKATDNQPHSIQLYSDISGEWVTNSLATPIQWSSSTVGSTSYHQVRSTAASSTFTDVAEDSVAYHAISTEQPNLVSVIGTDQALRAQFTANGASISLTSDLAGQFGNVRGSDGKFPVLAHAVNLGTVQTISSVAWAVGVVRDPITTFMNVTRRGYYWSQYATIDDAISAFVDDFPAARTRAIALDEQILRAATAVSQNYADLVSLATRQAMAGMDITLSTLPDGTWNFSDVKIFMKDVGNSQRVNPTETIYGALPALMYLNASFTGALLEPLLEYQSSATYTNQFAASDLGLGYPAVPGDPSSDTLFAVENSGNMLILALAHARSSGDGSLIGRYYPLLKQWADYLSNNSLIPAQQSPADSREANLGQTHGNITNLALKGIIAVQAMAEMSQIKGEAADAQKYGATAGSLAQSWMSMTMASSQLLWTYDESGSYGLMYNLLADKLLQLNLFPAAVYTAESTSLSTLSTNLPPFGYALSSESSGNTRSDWTLFTAATAPDNATRNSLISTVHAKASSNASAGTFPTLYNTQTGVGPGAGISPNGFASPAQGAMFSLLALAVPNKTVIIPPSAVGSSAPGNTTAAGSHSSNAGAIAGGVVGGLAAVLLLVGLAFFLRHRRRRSDADGEMAAPQPYDGAPNMAQMFDAPNESATSPTSGSGAEAVHVPPSRGPTVNAFSAKAAAMRGSVLRTANSEPISLPSSQPGSSHLPSVSGTSVSRGTNDENLRSEMVRLRQEVEQLRAAQVPQEAPPLYE
ncbi:hypothetical protein B0H16DRAFT_1359620 [Mycena metata]|uniref:DUF1793-domain-containing protein n=1 Tax=Mycena metata TaxID=1033252 RepID=A0AAD7K7N7_9AGAR|nr:hypothetical protein B0H16DRAFT_1359620 [Mycena metata]